MGEKQAVRLASACDRADDGLGCRLRARRVVGLRQEG